MKQEKKRTPLPSRKRVALRRIAIAAVVIFCVNFFMHIGLLLPIQSIWQLEEREGARHTSVVTRDWAPEVHRTHLVYLTENDDTTLFGSTYLTIYGWMAGFSVALDCTEEAPLYAGRSYMSRDDGKVWYFFGRVDDPAIETVAVSLQSEDWDEETQIFIRREVCRLTTAEFLEKDGRRYFLLRDGGEWDSDTCSSPRPVVIGYDSAGSEAARVDIEQGNASYFG